MLQLPSSEKKEFYIFSFHKLLFYILKEPVQQDFFWLLDRSSTARIVLVLFCFCHSIFSQGFQSRPSHQLLSLFSLAYFLWASPERLPDKVLWLTPLFLSLPLPVATCRSRARGSCTIFSWSLSVSARTTTSKAKRRTATRITWASDFSSRSECQVSHQEARAPQGLGGRRYRRRLLGRTTSDTPPMPSRGALILARADEREEEKPQGSTSTARSAGARGRHPRRGLHVRCLTSSSRHRSRAVDPARSVTPVNSSPWRPVQHQNSFPNK
jgi:hypothetical protein